ncbi:MAG TPA: phosphotransferase family protein [Candidatus Dormibacteraeota bacterium]|nr:phosphotransferase family protein [Candidatus Dormibacteraeota bacterium]
MEPIRTDLERQLRSTWGEPGLSVGEISPIAEGHSGFTYWVDVQRPGGGRRYVLRLTPPGARPAGAADVARQGRIMAALSAQGLPVPAIPAVSAEPVIDGRPFVLMEAIQADRIETVAPREDHRAIAASAVAVLRRIQAVPVAASGIADEEPMPLRGEMMRWAWLMERAAPDLTGRAPELGGRLAERVPAEVSPTVVHGDYHLGNLLFHGPEVAAVLDWEIAQLGQPLLDLACLCVMVARRRFDGGTAPGGSIEVEIGDFIRLYGADPQEMRWYLALSLYKYAAILGYNLMLHRKGRRPDPMYESESMARTIGGMIDDGIEMLDGKGSL